MTEGNDRDDGRGGEIGRNRRPHSHDRQAGNDQPTEGRRYDNRNRGSGTRRGDTDNSPAGVDGASDGDPDGADGTGRDDDTSDDGDEPDDTPTETPDRVAELEATVASLEKRVARLQDRVGADDSPDPDPTVGGRVDVDTLQTILEDHREAIREARDASTDLRREFEDYRDRAEAEREEIRRYSVEAFAREVIEVKDSLRETLAFLDLDDRAQRQFDVLDRQFDRALEAAGVREIDTDGTLDPGRHRPVGEVTAPDRPADEIVETETPGYELDDRVLRPAEVIVVAAD
jgi:molecular chaperone GrpE